MRTNTGSAVGDRTIQSNWVGSLECIFCLILHCSVFQAGVHGNIGTSIFDGPITAFGWESSDTFSVRNSGENRRKSSKGHDQNKKNQAAIDDPKTAVVGRFSLYLLGFQLHTHECFLTARNLSLSFFYLLNIVLKIRLQFVVLIAVVKVNTAADEHYYANTESEHLE